MNTIYIIKSPFHSWVCNQNLDGAPSFLPPSLSTSLITVSEATAQEGRSVSNFLASSSSSSPLISWLIYRREAVGELSGQGLYLVMYAEADSHTHAWNT